METLYERTKAQLEEHTRKMATTEDTMSRLERELDSVRALHAQNEREKDYTVDRLQKDLEMARLQQTQSKQDREGLLAQIRELEAQSLSTFSAS